MAESPGRGARWTWTLCVLLFFATLLNYMDRMTLIQLSSEIKDEFELKYEGYGNLESAFAISFATGALLGGWMVDRWNVWWVYPAAVFAWSLAGSATGLAQSYEALLASRICLGVAEAIHWPCALRTTQRILAKDQRTLGNSILQSGAAIGAVLTPQVIQGLQHWDPDWRPSFLVIGSFGIFWVLGWLLVVRRSDLALPGEPANLPSQAGRAPESLWAIFREKRFWVLIVMVLSINCTWHYFRVWLPLFLHKTHGYRLEQVQNFSSLYYLMTYLGSLAAGFGTLGLIRGGMKVHTGRMFVFGACALLTALSLLVSQLEKGPLLLGVLLVIGFGALGLFPNYYSFTQELTVKHQGKVTGILGCVNWIGLAAFHKWVGRNLDETNSYATGLTLAGLTPLLGLAALLLFWREKETV